MTNKFTLTEELYKTQEGEIVRAGSGRADSLYKPVGAKIPLEEAIELGLIDGDQVPASTEIEMKEGNLIKDATDEVLADILIHAIKEVKEREFDFAGDDLTNEQKASLTELFAEDDDEVTVPDGVVPGETPGWPVDAVTGKVLNLPDEVRDTLAAIKLEPAAVSYDALGKEELEQLIEDRQKALVPEGSGKGGNVVKADLVKALEACDAAQGGE